MTSNNNSLCQTLGSAAIGYSAMVSIFHFYPRIRDIYGGLDELSKSENFPTLPENQTDTPSGQERIRRQYSDDGGETWNTLTETVCESQAPDNNANLNTVASSLALVSWLATEGTILGISAYGLTYDNYLLAAAPLAVLATTNGIALLSKYFKRTNSEE